MIALGCAQGAGDHLVPPVMILGARIWSRAVAQLAERTDGLPLVGYNGACGLSAAWANRVVRGE